MADVLLEFDPAHIDTAAEAALVAILAEAGVEVGSTDEIHIFKGLAWWQVGLVWVGGEAGLHAFHAALDAVFDRIRAHFRNNKKAPPGRITLYGPDGEVLTIIERTDDED